MIERDEELQRLLKRWESPDPGPQLDERVWTAFRQSRSSQRGRWVRKWLPVAAGAIFAAGVARLWLQHPAQPRNISIETTMDAAGFRPIADGAITVVKSGGKQ